MDDKFLNTSRQVLFYMKNINSSTDNDNNDIMQYRNKLKESIQKVQDDADKEGIPAALLFRWKEWNKNINNAEDEAATLETCAVNKFFNGQAKLPIAMRNKSAHIVCQCKGCNPYSL